MTSRPTLTPTLSRSGRWAIVRSPRCARERAGRRPLLLPSRRRGAARRASAGAPRIRSRPSPCPRPTPRPRPRSTRACACMKWGKKALQGGAQARCSARPSSTAKLFEAWHDLGVIETALGNYDKAVDDFERALDIQPGVAQDACWPTARACAAPTGPRRRRQACTRSGWTSDPERLRHARALRAGAA